MYQAGPNSLEYNKLYHRPRCYVRRLVLTIAGLSSQAHHKYNSLNLNEQIKLVLMKNCKNCNRPLLPFPGTIEFSMDNRSLCFKCEGLKEFLVIGICDKLAEGRCLRERLKDIGLNPTTHSGLGKFYVAAVVPTEMVEYALFCFSAITGEGIVADPTISVKDAILVGAGKMKLENLN